MKDPMHGVTLEHIVTALVEAYGFPELSKRIPIRCFEHEPSVASSLTFLRRTPWARAKVEGLYLFHLREQKRRARRAHGSDVRAAAGLVVTATRGVMGVVGEMQAAIGPVPMITDLVTMALRGVTGLVGEGIDAAIAAIAPLLGESTPGEAREAVLAALNGVVGDQLDASKSPLAIPMTLRPPLLDLHRGGTLLVMVHGSCMNDLQWQQQGHDHGRALADELGCTLAYLHYNSGRHISENGAELAALLEREAAPFSDLVIVGHSMGGLVARAAIHVAEQAEHAWRARLRVLVTLASPHHGAPLERGGNVLELLLGVTKYTAPLRALGQIRSAGVTDLRFGSIAEADWRERDRFAHGADPRAPLALPAGVRCYAVAATTAAATSDPASLPSALSSDGVVPVDSALGRHANEAFALRFTESALVYECSHLGVLSRAEVYARLREWCAGLGG
ncbi:MAG: alpha/beta fold hydrolase [Deltaproteobacteria bacterium]|nr:alpha/beta fold hydrolase [Deltaproteobacteria bacterium]